MISMVHLLLQRKVRFCRTCHSVDHFAPEAPGHLFLGFQPRHLFAPSGLTHTWRASVTKVL